MSGVKADQRAAPVGRSADLLQRRQRMALAEALLVQFLVARDLDQRVGRQRVDHRDADAVQAARGLVRLVAELAARVQRGEDHLQRRLAGIARMLVDRDAAAIVGDGEAVARTQRHLDAAGVPGDRLVHRIVEHLGGEVVQRALVGAADIHARPAADGFEPLQHLDRGGVVAFGRHGAGRSEEIVGHRGASLAGRRGQSKARSVFVSAGPRKEEGRPHRCGRPPVS